METKAEGLGILGHPHQLSERFLNVLDASGNTLLTVNEEGARELLRKRAAYPKWSERGRIVALIARTSRPVETDNGPVRGRNPEADEESYAWLFQFVRWPSIFASAGPMRPSVFDVAPLELPVISDPDYAMPKRPKVISMRQKPKRSWTDAVAA